VRFSPTEAQALIRDATRRFAQEMVLPGAKERDQTETFSDDLLKQAAQLGLLGINIRSEFGGAEAGAVAYALAIMELSWACASTAVGIAVTNMCAELLQARGSHLQKARFLSSLVSGARGPGAFALSEPHCGSDVAALKTSAVKVGNDWVLNGAKQWVTSGDKAGILLVWARTGAPTEAGTRALSTFIVEAGTPGLSAGKREKKMGLRASPTAALMLEDCRIPAENLLGEEGEGFRLAMRALDGGRIGIASQACGVARAALEEAVRYTRDRKAFGQSVSEFEAVRFFLADMKTQLSAAELLTLRAAALKEVGAPFTLEASMAKLYASEMANRVCDRALHLHGGYGYLDEFAAERLFRDARVQTLYEGTSEIQRLVISRDLLRRSP
jgi:alkylation response protein AidB-like acyl-CoA dehydrogenase